MGAVQAAGDVLIFCDGDDLVEPDWVASHLHVQNLYEKKERATARGLYRPHIAGVAGSGTLGCIYYPQGIGGIVAFDHGASAVGTAVITNEHLKTRVTGLGCEGIKLLRNIVGGSQTYKPYDSFSGGVSDGRKSWGAGGYSSVPHPQTYSEAATFRYCAYYRGVRYYSRELEHG